ncbi:MAG: CHASE2 domain-containing protein [Bdellovibrionota bacterium]
MRLFSAWLLHRWRNIRPHRGLALRLLLSLAIGILALEVDEQNQYDLRFQLRGPQKTSSQIILVTLQPSDIFRSQAHRRQSVLGVDDYASFSDAFYWDREIWKKLLTTVLQHNPRAVGVTLYFGSNVGNSGFSTEEKKVFLDPRITWSSTSNTFDEPLLPAFANPLESNFGPNEIRRDEDGVVRRVFSQKEELSHLVEKITQKRFPTREESLVINYRGTPDLFTRVTLSELFSSSFPKEFLKDKIILIGASATGNSQYLTPLGPMSRTEIIAQITDNMAERRWVTKLPMLLYALAFLIIAIGAMMIIVTYPQSVVLIFYLMLSILFAALSAWVFDTFALWVPAFSPFVLLATIWIIMVGYQAASLERKHFLLQQEQKNLHELEQLKNNFVSLISHDLKTPIAKIQGIVQRWQAEKPTDFNTELGHLSNYTEDLNRYIQSILKVLRVESRDFKLHLEVADLNELIFEAVQDLSPLAQDKSIALQTQLEPHFTLEIDVTLIKEVILNLIENGIKYSPIGSQIKIISREDDDHVWVEIVDQGPGIPAEELENIFGKFVRGKDQDMRTKGTGLGLYLVKYFIELHGGKVILESVVGSGTKVAFSLPLITEIDEFVPQDEEGEPS